MQADPERIARALRLLEIQEEDQAAVANLTPQQALVLGYIAKGMANKEIANLIELSVHTVNDLSKQIFKRLNVSGRVEAAVIATKAGMA